MQTTRLLSSVAACLLLPAAGLTSLCAQDSRPSADDDARAKISDAQIERLMTALDSVSTGREMLAKSLDNIERMPGLPPGFAERFEEEFDLAAVKDRIHGVWREHLPADAAASAIAFYESAAGKRWTTIRAEVSEEAFDVGMREGQKIAGKIMSGAKIEPVEPIDPEPGSEEALLMTALELSRASEQADAVLAVQAEQMAQMPGLPAGFAEKFRKAMSGERIVRLSMQLYLERIDEDTLKAFNEWAETPEARTFHAAMTEIMPAATRIGADEGRKAGERAAMPRGR